MSPGIHTIFAALLSCYYITVASADDAATLLMNAEETASPMNFNNMSASGKEGRANVNTNDTVIEAFPAHIKTSFFISAATTLCILLSCSFLVGLYEVHDRKKQKPVKTHA
ncbi:hypothetical protein Y032_0183g931 [Ancylostoma ceylanicum]|nr:hypothetical protein Y032_0183g931 [Ancylostoma ceylanicum]